MKEKNKLIIAIIAVILIIIVIVGATYAYWRWATNPNERININLSVPSGTTLLRASLDGGTMSVSNLAPVASCDNTHYAAKSTVTLTYFNQTTTNASVYGTLSVSNFTKPHGTATAPSASDLTHLQYSLRTGDTNCTNGTEIASGNFSGLYNLTSGVLANNIVLESNIVPGNNERNKIMHLYVWLDSNYEYTNIGSGNISDPMQDISLTLTWSGEITNG